MRGFKIAYLHGIFDCGETYHRGNPFAHKRNIEKQTGIKYKLEFMDLRLKKYRLVPDES